MTRPALAAAALMLAGTGAALAETVEFTADAIQRQPGQGLQSGKLYVGANGSRFEFQDHGRPIVQISLPAEGLVRVLSPLDRSYMELKSDNGAGTPDGRPSEPCTPSPEVECKREGEDQILGMKLERWSVKPSGAPGEMRVWWDKERRMPLRQVLFDGSTMQAAMTGNEDHDGRQVESWEITYTSPNGQYRRGMALYAPDIRSTVLEHQPGGTMRELRNIVVGKLEAKLFEVPEGYRKLELPPPPKPGEVPAPQAGMAPPAPQATTPQKQAQPQPAPAQPMGPPRPPQAAAPPQSAPPAPPAGPYAGAAPHGGPQMGQDMQMGPPPGYPVGPRFGRHMVMPPDMQGMGGQQGMSGMSGTTGMTGQQGMGGQSGMSGMTGMAGAPQGGPQMGQDMQMGPPPGYPVGPRFGRHMVMPPDMQGMGGMGGQQGMSGMSGTTGMAGQQGMGGQSGMSGMTGAPQGGPQMGQDMQMGPPPGYPVGPRFGRHMMMPPDMQGMGGQQGMSGMSRMSGMAGQPGLPSAAELDQMEQQMQVPPRYRMGPYGSRGMPWPADMGPQGGMSGDGGQATMPPAGAPGQPEMSGLPGYAPYGVPMGQPPQGQTPAPPTSPAGMPPQPGYGYGYGPGPGYGAGPQGGGYGPMPYGYGPPRGYPPYQGGQPQ